MNLPQEGVLLRVFIGERDTYKGQPLYQAIVLKARELDIAGATVLRGMMGYGDSSRLHTSKVLMLSEDLPVVVEIVDTAENIELLKDYIEEVVDEALITMEKVQVIRYPFQRKGNN